MELKYLVTGTGRCGTVYMARLLTSVGIPCGHEAIFDWRGYRWAERRLAGEEPIQCSHASTVRFENGTWFPMPDWVDPGEVVAESSYMAAPFLGEDLLRGVPVIHVVRNPVRVINSFCNYIGYFQRSAPSNSYEQFIYRHLPEVGKLQTAYDRAAAFYVGWNRMIERHSVHTFRIEDAPQAVLSFLGRTGECYDDRSINSYQKPGARFSLDQLEDDSLSKELVEMGERYGYSMSQKLLLI